MKGRRILELYNEHAKQCSPTDFLGQMRRTVNGEAIDAHQVEMIVERITAGLNLAPEDMVLDLCCGNGALSDRIFSRSAGGVGVDIGDYLIELATKYFNGANREFVVSDVVDYVRAESNPGRFTKVLCYGSFAYLSKENALELLSVVRERFPKIERFFIGNLPDKDRMNDFYYDRTYVEGLEDDSDSHIGVWRTDREFVDLAEEVGWRAEISRMPKAFYAAHYRYDVTLSPRAGT